MNRRGNTLIIVALMVVVLIGVGAFVVDLGNARVTRTTAQSVADAIAIAAAQTLDGTAEGVTLAQTVASDLATENHVAGHAVVLDDDEDPVHATIELGVWAPGAHTFTVDTDPEDLDAARVTVQVQNAGTWFSQAALSRESLPVMGQATAAWLGASGASQVECFIPLALPACLIEDFHDLDTVQDVTMVLSPAGIDNAGWARPGAHPNANWIRQQILDCEASGVVGIGDPVGLNNGLISTALTAIADAIQDNDTTWDADVWGALPAQIAGSAVSASAYGHTYEGPIVIFDDPSYCMGGGGSWVGSQVVSGIAWGAIYDVRATGGAANQNIHLRVDTSRAHWDGTEGGGTDYGVTDPGTVVLVR